MKIVQIEPLGITDEQLKSLVEKLENNGDEMQVALMYL